MQQFRKEERNCVSDSVQEEMNCNPCPEHAK